MIETLGLVLLTLGLLFLSGYASTLLLMPRQLGVPRLLVMPVAGLASNIALTFLLAAFSLTGHAIAWTSIGVFVVSAFLVPKARRLTKVEIVASAVPLAICLFAFCIICWPLLVDGFRNYIAYGNPDAAFNIGVNEYLQGHAFNMPPTDSYHSWPSGFRIPFGIGYLMVTVSEITGVSVLSLHEVTASCLIFCIPASIFAFVIWSLEGTRRTALIAAGASSVSSLIAYNFYLQSIGAATLIVLLPAILGVWSFAAKSMNWRLFALTGILASGVFYGYYASAPIIAILLTIDAVVRIVRKEIRWLPALAALLAIAAIVILTYPDQWRELATRVLSEGGSQRLSARIDGPEVLLSFGFTLTEDLFPFMWGISLTHGSAVNLIGIAGTVLLQVMGAALLVVLLVITVKSTDVPLAPRAQLIALLLISCYFIYKHNGYGVFKFAMWMPVLLLAYLVRGLVEEHGQAAPFKSLRMLTILVTVGLNLTILVLLSPTSLAARPGALKPMTGYQMSDFSELRSLNRFVKPNESIMISVPGAVVQRWIFTYLTPFKVSILPALELSPDLLGPWADSYYHGSEDSYLLSFAGAGADLLPSPQKVVWRNRKFQLTSLKDLSNYATLGVGWYDFEHIASPPFDWMRHFRWLRREGEILLFNLQPGQRLALSMAAGYGKDDPDRSAEIYCDGRLLDRVTIRGYTNFITSPIPPSGFLTRITIKLPDDAKPIDRFPALLNRWVPKDVRRLNIAVSNIGLIGPQEYQSVSGSSEFAFEKGSQAWDAPLLNGVFPDGWIAGKATLPVMVCPGSKDLVIEGSAPGIPGLNFPLRVDIDGLGPGAGSLTIPKAGDFRLSLKIEAQTEGCRNRLVSLTPSQSIIPAKVVRSSDKRPLSVRLSKVFLR